MRSEEFKVACLPLYTSISSNLAFFFPPFLYPFLHSFFPLPFFPPSSPSFNLPSLLFFLQSSLPPLLPSIFHPSSLSFNLPSLLSFLQSSIPPLLPSIFHPSSPSFNLPSLLSFLQSSLPPLLPSIFPPSSPRKTDLLIVFLARDNLR